MEFSNLTTHITYILTEEEFEEWVVFCWSIWLAWNHLIYDKAIMSLKQSSSELQMS